MVDTCSPKSISVNTCNLSAATSASLASPIKHTQDWGFDIRAFLCPNPTY